MFFNPLQVGGTLHKETRSTRVKNQGYGTIGFWFVWTAVFKFKLQSMMTTIDLLHAIVLFTLFHKSQNMMSVISMITDIMFSQIFMVTFVRDFTQIESP